MNQVSADQFDELLKEAPMKPRMKRDIKFRASTERMDDVAWQETELLPLWNKSRNGGILLIQLSGHLYMIAYDSTKSATDTTGRSKSVICDLCYTWQSNSGGGFVTFYPDKSGDKSFSLLCCRDLACSANVRTKTTAALRSRAQLREDLTNADRVERLQHKIAAFTKRLGIAPVGDIL